VWVGDAHACSRLAPEPRWKVWWLGVFPYADCMRMGFRVAGVVIGVSLMGGGAWLLRRRSARRSPLPAGVEAIDEVCGDFPVLDYESLVERTESGPLIELLRIKLGMPREVFDSAVRPVIEGYAQYVQLLPAVPSRQATPSWLLVDTLTRVLRALDYRRGQILPCGAPPEVIGAQMHRWTYAVFIAALLCDIDGAMNELKVTIWGCDGRQVRWMPSTGGMQASGAQRYRVECVERAATATSSPGSLAVLLLDRIIPPSVFAWLTAEPEPMGELRGFLVGDDAAKSGAIASIVMRARTGFGGASAPAVLMSECGPGPRASTPAAFVEHEKVDHGGDEAKSSSPITRPGAAQASGTGDPLGSPGGDSPLASVMAEVRPASASPIVAAEFLDDFGAQYGSSQSLRNRGGTAGKVERSGSVGEVRPTAPEELRPRGPSPEVDRFMHWLQLGLADGSLPFNQHDAVVHFVPEGMLLVSPQIFRDYAMQCGEHTQRGPATFAEGDTESGKAIQLQVLRAGWHVRGRKRSNILSYQVMRGDDPVSRLSGVVIRNPERFVTPVPPVNPMLIRLPPEHPQA